MFSTELRAVRECSAVLASSSVVSVPSRINFSKPKSIAEYCINRVMTDSQMICRIIQCHPSIRQNQFTCTFNVVSRGCGRPSGSFFMTDTYATFFELLYPFKHTCSRQNAFLILCTKCSINIGTRHALQPQNTNRYMLLFFRTNHKWGIHK